MLRARRGDISAVLGLAATLVVLAIMMQNLSYEVWAGILVVPVLAAPSLLLLRVLTRRAHRHLFIIFVAGLAAKFVASILRFYVFASLYSGDGDAGLYYDTGLALAARVRNGTSSISTVLPWETGLEFMYRIAGLVLTVVGPTKIGTFFVFAMLGFWGTVLIVLAGCRAVPGINQRRYATFCMLAPSLLFWPASIGKEATVLLGIGLFAYGASRLLAWDRRLLGILQIGIGGFIIASVRAHLAALFVFGLVVALLQVAFVPTATTITRKRTSFAVLAVCASALLVVVAFAAVRRLGVDNPNTGFFEDVSAALDKASVVSDSGGTSFTPVDTDNPLMWPYAIVRTLFRPLPIDLDGPKTLLPMLETTLLAGLIVASASRLRRIGSMLRRSPYLTFAFVTTALFGLAFSAISNLGALIRQRSLVWGFLLLLVCLPAASKSDRRGSDWARSDTVADPRKRRDQPTEAGAAASRA